MDLAIITNRDRLVEFCNNGLEAPDIKTTHEFVDGMYFRTMLAPAGSLIVGTTHKKDSYEILLKGTIIINDGDDTVEMTAPLTKTTLVGSQKNGYCVTEVVYMSIFRSDIVDIDELEEELYEEETYNKRSKEIRCQESL